VHAQDRQSLIRYVKMAHNDIHSNTATEPAASDSSHSLSDGRDVNGDNEQDLYSFVEKSGTNAVLSQSMCVVNLSVQFIIIFTVD